MRVFNLLILPVVAALETPETFLSADERDLFLKGAGCQIRLDACEATTGGNFPPFEAWADLLGQSDECGANNSEDMATIVEMAANIDLKKLIILPLPGNLFDNNLLVKRIQKAMTALLAFEMPEPNAGILFIADAITALDTFLDATGNDLIPTQVLDLIIFVLEFLAGFLGVLGEGPTTIVIYILTQVIAFINDFFRTEVSRRLFKATADSECMDAANACFFRLFTLNVIPALMGASFLANGLAITADYRP